MNTGKTMKTDLETLTALNRDYIASVQNGDVRRFEEILADDVLCSNPDATLVDRQQFLAQTAQPVMISGLVADDVRIRILDDVAQGSGNEPPRVSPAFWSITSRLELAIRPQKDRRRPRGAERVRCRGKPFRRWRVHVRFQRREIGEP
jgi:hypothetical protein